jgi:hypothetical protein
MRKHFSLERLEDRTVFSRGDTLTNAIPVAFVRNNASLSSYLATPQDVQLAALSLAAGDTVTAAVDTQPYGGGLDSYLRAFDGGGVQIASNDNYGGRDARLTFQAPAAGTYYVGVSAAGDTRYDPRVARSGQGTSTGMFDLHLSKAPTALPLQPDLVGASFQIVQSAAVWGDTVTVRYAIENRGGADAGPFDVELRLSADNRINDDAGDPLLATVHVAGLAAGTATATTTVTVTLPGSPGMPPGSFQEPQTVFLGLRIANRDSRSPEQGNDWAALPIVMAQTASEPNDHSWIANRIGLNAQMTGSLSGKDNVDFFQLDLEDRGNGRLIARVHAGFGVRLSLLGQDGESQLLIQSDGGLSGQGDAIIDQHLINHAGGGSYFLRVEGLGGGTGMYTLTTQFQPSGVPFEQIDVGTAARHLVTGDFNGDGIPDVAVTDPNGDRVAVLLGVGDGTFQPPAFYPVGLTPDALVAGDFSGDGILDLAVADSGFNLNDPTTPLGPGDVSILLGNGDGTFQQAEQFALGIGPGPFEPVALVAGDFTGQGTLDLATVNVLSGDISVLRGSGDGQFTLQAQYTLGLPPRALAAGAFNGDGRRLVAGDFNGDGRLDLAVAVPDGYVTLFLGQPDGTFQQLLDDTGMARRFPVGTDPTSLVTGRFHDDNGDGLIDERDFLDLAVANAGSADVSVLRGNGDGTFQTAVSYAVGGNPFDLVAADFNGDGRLDLATSNQGTEDVSVLLGRGDNTFADQQRLAVPSVPFGIVAADFNDDGRVDLASANNGPNGNVSLFAGLGNGAFQDPVDNAVGDAPVATVTGDFNNDGFLDLATANGSLDPASAGQRKGDVSILLGQGNGLFQAQRRIPMNGLPLALVTGDFNNDGFLDLAVLVAEPAGRGAHVSILLGQGNGTFPTAEDVPVPNGSTSLVAGDFNADGRLDLAVAVNDPSNPNGYVTLFLGQANGMFQPLLDNTGTPRRFPVGANPVALVAGDFHGDGHLDLAVADAGSQDVSVLGGNGAGTFQAAVAYPLSNTPTALVVGRFQDDNGDGRIDDRDFLDLAVAGKGPNAVSVLRGNGAGTFQAAVAYPMSGMPRALVVGRFQDDNGDGQIDNRDFPDIVATDLGGGAVSLFRGLGNGTFQQETFVTSFGNPLSLATGDFNGDHNSDLAIADNKFPDHVTVLLGLGGQASSDGSNFYFNNNFTNGIGLAATSVQSTPLFLDVNGDHVPDVVTVSGSGQILLRLGQPNEPPGAFAPPLLINPDRPARAVTTVQAGSQVLLAAADQVGNTVSLYAIAADGRATLVPGSPFPSGGVLPTRILSGNLQGQADGFPDLVVLNALSDSVARPSAAMAVFLADGRGGFGPPTTLNVGSGPSDIALADVNGDGALDILVTNQLSGDVSVLFNDGHGQFAMEQRYRAGLGVYGDNSANFLKLLSGDRSGGAVAGDFTSPGTSDTIVFNTGSNSFTLLRGQGGGSLANPLPTLVGFGPTAAVAGRFHDSNDDGHIDAGDPLDLALLNQDADEVSIFLNDGAGHFTQRSTVAAGNAPTSLAVADVNGDGVPDLLVGNAFGDVLILFGKGDGTFQPYQRVDQNIGLAVVNSQQFILSNEAQDRLVVQGGIGSASTVVQDRSSGILAPGKPQIATVGNTQYLVVPNSGANEVRIYPLVNGLPDASQVQIYPVGTDPVGVTIAYLNDDLTPDPATGKMVDRTPDLVVANQGATYVTVLLGQVQGGNWTLRTPGLILQTGGSGPAATVVQDVTGDGVPDILVSNSQSSNVTLLPGVGQGFFNDQNLQPLPVGSRPGAILSVPGPEGSNFVTINSGSGNVTEFNFSPVSGQLQAVATVASGGPNPATALAGDFNHDGFGDLLVGNDNGVFALLLGGPNGLSEQESFVTEFLHPTDLALAELGNHTLDVFATQEGVESVTRLTFPLEGAVPGPPNQQPQFSPGPQGGGGRPEIAELAPLESEGRAVIAILVAGNRELEVFGTAIDVALAAAGNRELEASVTDNDASDAEVKDVPDDKPMPEAPDGDAGRSNFLRGLDGALVKLEQQSAPAASVPGPGPLAWPRLPIVVAVVEPAASEPLPASPRTDFEQPGPARPLIDDVRLAARDAPRRSDAWPQETPASFSPGWTSPPEPVLADLGQPGSGPALAETEVPDATPVRNPPALGQMTWQETLATALFTAGAGQVVRNAGSGSRRTTSTPRQRYRPRLLDGVSQD